MSHPVSAVLGSAFFSCLSMSIAGVALSRDRLMGIGQAITMPLFFQLERALPGKAHARRAGAASWGGGPGRAVPAVNAKACPDRVTDRAAALRAAAHAGVA